MHVSTATFTQTRLILVIFPIVAKQIYHVITISVNDVIPTLPVLTNVNTSVETERLRLSGLHPGVIVRSFHYLVGARIFWNIYVLRTLMTSLVRSSARICYVALPSVTQARENQAKWSHAYIRRSTPNVTWSSH